MMTATSPFSIVTDRIPCGKGTLSILPDVRYNHEIDAMPLPLAKA